MVTESLRRCGGRVPRVGCARCLARRRCRSSGVLDLHANVSTEKMGASSRTASRWPIAKNPHALMAKRRRDARDRDLLGALPARRASCRTWSGAGVPLVWAPPGTGTAADPMLRVGAPGALITTKPRSAPTSGRCNVAAGFCVRRHAVHTGRVTFRPSSAVAGEAAAQAELEEFGSVLRGISAKARPKCDYPSVGEVVARLAARAAVAKRPRTLLVEPADNIGAWRARRRHRDVLRALFWPTASVNARSSCLNDPAAVETLRWPMRVPARPRCASAVGGRGWRARCRVPWRSTRESCFVQRRQFSALEDRAQPFGLDERRALSRWVRAQS